MSDKKRQKVEELYKRYGIVVQRYLRLKFDLQRPDAEDILQTIFAEKIFPSIGFIINGKIILRNTRPILNEEAWILTITKNTANDFIKAQIRSRGEWDKNYKNKKNTQDKSKENEWAPQPTSMLPETIDSVDELESPLPSPEEVVDEPKIAACRRKCYRMSLEQPHAICPLIIALCELETPVGRMAEILFKSRSDTEKLLKKCYHEMKTLKTARGERGSRFPREKGILERCREEKANYQDYYNDYQAKHSRQEGAGSLCWLLAELIAKDMTWGEIGQLINKDSKTAQKTWERCLDLIYEEFEKCLRQICG